MDYAALGDIHEENLDPLKLSRGIHAFRSKFKTQQIFAKSMTPFDGSKFCF